MSAAKIGTPVTYIANVGTGGGEPGQVFSVNTDGTVDVVEYHSLTAAWRERKALPYVEIGGTPPTSGGYAQEV